MGIKVVENNPPMAPEKVKACVPPLPFPQRLWKKSMEENIHAIATRSRKQLSETAAKRQKQKDEQKEADGATTVEKFVPIATENREIT